jgi:hypothetical protein
MKNNCDTVDSNAQITSERIAPLTLVLEPHLELHVSLSAMEPVVQVSEEHPVLCDYHALTCNILSPA